MSTKKSPRKKSPGTAKKKTATRKTNSGFGRGKKRKTNEDAALREPSSSNKKRKTSPYSSGGGIAAIDKSEKRASRDSNVRRALPKDYECNGQMVRNNFSDKVTARDVEYVTPCFSSYSVDRNGKTYSTLTENLASVIERFGKGKTVLGCVAWLSNARILEALTKCRRVLLIVNREHYDSWGAGTFKKYASLPRFDQPLWVALGHLNDTFATLETDRNSVKSRYSCVRAFGNPSSGGKSEGLEHCKYLVFFETECYHYFKTSENGNVTAVPDPENFVYKETPVAVWTGSMNMTKASETHHENAVFIKSKTTAQAYFEDFTNTFMASTPLKCKNKNQTPNENKITY